jgi:hypothetical protein
MLQRGVEEFFGRSIGFGEGSKVAWVLSADATLALPRDEQFPALLD